MGHYYVVLETEDGSKIVTEQLANGRTTWQENPEDLDYRSSFAKVIATKIGGMQVRDVKAFQETESQRESQASQSACKWYARGVCGKACGEVDSMKNLYNQSLTLKRNGVNVRPPTATVSNVPFVNFRDAYYANQKTL